MHKLANWCV